MSSPLTNSATLERIEARTVFGLRFWDAYLARTISAGLHVRAQRVEQRNAQNGTISAIERIGRVATGQQTPSGTFIFPELHSTVRLTTEEIAAHRVLIEMTDRLHRYLPLSFILPLPNANARPMQQHAAGVANTPLSRAALNGEVAQGIYLYSAPGRTPPAGAALLLAQLAIGDDEEEGSAPAPASFALVEVRDLKVTGHPARSYFGMSDAAGSLLIPLPYPTPTVVGDNAPILQQQDFALKVEIRFEPERHFTAPGSPVPLLQTLLTQGAVQVLNEVTEGGGAPQMETISTLERNLRFGQPLVLRTRPSQPYLRVAVA